METRSFNLLCPDFSACEAMLQETYQEIRHLHATPAAKAFIAAHWLRYVNILSHLPALEKNAPVLEVGASILSSVLKRRVGAQVHTAFHELETEWQGRFAEEGILGTPVELLRDPLPYSPGTFALILFDEVMEHFPLRADFLVSQLIRLLRPGGQLILSVPNFASWEHRVDLVRGRNPQDEMDDKFIYYAHHREPVMSECLQLASRCGGVVTEYFWTDYAAPVSKARTAWNILRYLKHLEFHKIAHVLVPSMRSYLFLRIEQNPLAEKFPLPPPPMAHSKEFAARP